MAKLIKVEHRRPWVLLDKGGDIIYGHVNMDDFRTVFWEKGAAIRMQNRVLHVTGEETDVVRMEMRVLKRRPRKEAPSGEVKST